MSDGPAADDGYAAMIQATRDFLDKFAAAKPSPALIAALTNDLRGWSDRLAQVEAVASDAR